MVWRGTFSDGGVAAAAAHFPLPLSAGVVDGGGADDVAEYEDDVVEEGRIGGQFGRMLTGSSDNGNALCPFFFLTV